MPQIKEMAQLTFTSQEVAEMVEQLIRSKSPEAADIDVNFSVEEVEEVEDGVTYKVYSMNWCVVTVSGVNAAQDWTTPKKQKTVLKNGSVRVAAPVTPVAPVQSPA